MSGPCFTLYFGSLAPPTLQKCLASISGAAVQPDPHGFRVRLAVSAIPRRLRQPGETERRQCEYMLTLRASSLVSTPRSTQESVRAALKTLPSVMVECCAATKSHLEVDGLWVLEERIVGDLGGWFLFGENALPERAEQLTEGLITVHVADYEGYFGTMTKDPAYVAQYEEYVPRKTMHFVEARSSGFRHLDY